MLNIKVGEKYRTSNGLEAYVYAKKEKGFMYVVKDVDNPMCFHCDEHGINSGASGNVDYDKFSLVEPIDMSCEDCIHYGTCNGWAKNEICEGFQSKYMKDIKLCGFHAQCFVNGEKRWGHFGGCMCQHMCESGPVGESVFSTCKLTGERVAVYTNEEEYKKLK